MPVETIVVLSVVCVLFAVFMAMLFFVSLPSQSHWDGMELGEKKHRAGKDFPANMSHQGY